MSILATAEFFVKPEKVEEFLGLLKGALPDTRSFKGCEHLETYVNQDDPGHVFLIESWSTRSDNESYLEWRIETGMMDVLTPYVTAPPKFAYFDARPEI
jgi:quinol monooxygenase YgiN